MAQEVWHIPTSDEELVDVFVEEVGELLRSIDEHLKSWAGKPGDKQILTEVRRSFHTIKGSGRMVKALDLSELAWRVEKMLNQAIAGAVPASDAMVKLVASVRGQIPGMVDAFKHRRSVAGGREIENLMKAADALAAGNASVPVTPLRAVAATAGEQDRRLQQLGARLEMTVQRADEALHRSEMALQQARRAFAQSENRKPPDRRDLYRELDRMGEVVNRLSKEVADLRREQGRSQRRPVSGDGEASRIAGQAAQPAATSGTEILARRSEAALGEGPPGNRETPRFGWPSLILSALLGGAIATAAIVFVLSLA